VTFKVTCPVFTLAIWLIDRLAVDACTRRTSVLVVRVDVIDEDDQSGVCHVCGERRLEMVLRSNMVEPNRCVAGTDFPMDWATVGSSMDASRNEPKCLHQEVVRGRDVLICE
jgi:hypothetical protein